MEGKFLDIDNCIIIHDVKQIKKEPAEKKIKTKRQLSKQLSKKKILSGSEIAIYNRLYRAEKDGFKEEDKELIDVLLSILEVDKDELVKKA